MPSRKEQPYLYEVDTHICYGISRTWAIYKKDRKTGKAFAVAYPVVIFKLNLKNSLIKKFLIKKLSSDNFLNQIVL